MKQLSGFRPLTGSKVSELRYSNHYTLHKMRFRPLTGSKVSEHNVKYIELVLD